MNFSSAHIAPIRLFQCFIIHSQYQGVRLESADVPDIGCKPHYKPDSDVGSRVRLVFYLHLMPFNRIERSAVIPDSEYYPLFLGKQPDVDQVFLLGLESMLDDVLAHLLHEKGNLVGRPHAVTVLHVEQHGYS